MPTTERITMTMRELDRFKVIQDVADGMVTPWRAAERLGLTTRQVHRLVGRLREHGPTGLISGRRSRWRRLRAYAALTLRLVRPINIRQRRLQSLNKTLKCIEGPVDASVLGEPDFCV